MRDRARVVYEMLLRSPPSMLMSTKSTYSIEHYPEPRTSVSVAHGNHQPTPHATWELWNIFLRAPFHRNDAMWSRPGRCPPVSLYTRRGPSRCEPLPRNDLWATDLCVLVVQHPPHCALANVWSSSLPRRRRCRKVRCLHPQWGFCPLLHWRGMTSIFLLCRCLWCGGLRPHGRFCCGMYRLS